MNKNQLLSTSKKRNSLRETRGCGEEEGHDAETLFSRLKKDGENYFWQMWYPLRCQPKYCKTAKWKLTKTVNPRNVLKKCEEDAFQEIFQNSKTNYPANIYLFKANNENTRKRC